MARSRSPIAAATLYAVLGVAGYQLAAGGALGAGAKTWATGTWGKVRAALPGGGAGQSQSSPAGMGSSPAQQAPASGQNQTQPTGTTAYTGPSSFQGGSGPGAAGQLVIQGFVRAYGLDPSNHGSPWVIYYDQQFNSWPDDDLISGNTNPADLYNYAVNAIGYLTQIGVM